MLNYHQRQRHKMIEKWLENPAPLEEFSKKYGISVRSFYYWRTHYQRYKTKTLYPEPAFTKVEREPKKPQTEGSSIQIEYPNGVVISVPKGTEKDTLIKLINLI